MYKIQLSANNLTSVLSIMSLMYMRNNNGPKMDPRRTPEETSKEEEDFLSQQTYLLHKYDARHISKREFLDEASDFISSFVCDTLSSAFSRSGTITSTCLLLLIARQVVDKLD